MTRLFVVTLILSLSLNCFAQKVTQKKNLPEEDTAFTVVALQQNNYDKTLVFDMGEKASIFLSLDEIRKGVNKYSTLEFTKTEFKPVKLFLDSISAQRDTVFVDLKTVFKIKHLISEQLQKGNARVFYKKRQAFVDTILHRLERYGST